MIKHLTYSVLFPSTGRELKGHHTFADGLTAITGANESGKSMILEMIRFCLFGTDALRGAATDYKGLKAALDFVVRGTDYTVARSGSKAELFSMTPLLGTGPLQAVKGDIAASGTKAVNAKVIELLGYDLMVFDTANSANQGEIEALGAMKPAQRKAMVDQTIGLNALDDVGKLVSERLSMERDRSKFDGVEPTAPVKPDGYTQSATVRITLDQLQAEVSELNQLRGWLQAAAPAKPTLPVCKITETVEQLQAHQAERVRVVALKSQLHSLRKPTHTAKQIDQLGRQLILWTLWQEKKALPPVPVYGAEELDEMEADIKAHVRYCEYLDIKQKLAEAVGHGMNHCPKCEHEWPLLAGQVETLERVLEKFEGVADRPLPSLTLPQITVQREALAREQALAPTRLRLQDVTEVRDPGVRQADLDRAQAALDDAQRYAQLDALVVPADRTKDLQARQQFDWATANYKQLKDEYDAYKLLREDRLARHDALLPIEGRLAAANKQLLEALTYEGSQERYEANLADYQRVKAIADAHAAKADQYDRARDGLKELKVRVKQYLVPSLSAAASQLLSLMTGGKRNVIEVSEEFDIKVDGQPLNTLSGSGKAAANLAIRIGLGQVLTNKVFSVFMGDEIDAAMDAERAGFTAECLRGLTSTIKQVVLVSHKEHEADHQIKVAA